jgi:hypothetical protein
MKTLLWVSALAIGTALGILAALVHVDTVRQLRACQARLAGKDRSRGYVDAW